MLSINSCNIEPTPSDFSKFVYCGMKWILDKNDKNIKDKKLSSQSYDKSNQTVALESGQRNESVCIKWILRYLDLAEKNILFDGVGDSNEYLNIVNELDSTWIKCKPDLIVSNSKSNLLFEFKAVKNYNYLNMLEFEANRAQIWCYSKIEEIPIDRYYLFRYYVNPFYKIPSYNKPAYDLKEITFSNDEEIYFRENFTNYLKYIKMYKAIDLGLVSKIMKFNTPVTETDKVKKCSSCYYKNKNICNKEEFERQTSLY